MKKYWFTIVSLILGIGCFLAYQFIGTKVTLDGALIESFGWIPVGYGLFFLGLLVGVIQFVRARLRKSR